MRDLRDGARLSTFLKDQAHRVQPVQNGRDGASGYLAGANVFQDLFEGLQRIHQTAFLQTELQVDDVVDPALLADLEKRIAELFETVGVQVEQREKRLETMPRTPSGEIDLVSMMRARIEPEGQPLKRLPRGSAPKSRLKAQKGRARTK